VALVRKEEKDPTGTLHSHPTSEREGRKERKKGIFLKRETARSTPRKKRENRDSVPSISPWEKKEREDFFHTVKKKKKWSPRGGAG